MSVTRPPVPLDDALPAMPRMLDVEHMVPVLERSLGGARSIDSITIRYLRYKQGRSLLVRYEVVVDGAAHGVVALAEPDGRLQQKAEKPANLELAAKAAELSGLSERTIFEILMQREKLGSTGVGSGIAIPHGKLPKLSKLFGLFARLERPVDFEALYSVLALPSASAA